MEKHIRIKNFYIASLESINNTVNTFIKTFPYIFQEVDNKNIF